MNTILVYRLNTDGTRSIVEVKVVSYEFRSLSDHFLLFINVGLNCGLLDNVSFISDRKIDSFFFVQQNNVT